LHSALLQHVPRESIHLNKKVAGAVATDDKVTLYFEDGSEAHGDLLIGADGIKSVRLVPFSHNFSFSNL
jgi:salicylate hydroxylase